MTTELVMTPTLAIILRRMLQSPKERYYCFGICGELGMQNGTVSPLLGRLEESGWVTSSVEKRGRYMPRRWYRFTPDGIKAARAEIKKWKFTDAPL